MMEENSQTPSPLDNIVDDDAAVQECFEWLVEQMGRGETPEDLKAQMIANGWSGDDAEELVEQARRRTRGLRGVVTREEVARSSYNRYRKSMAGVRGIMYFGVFGAAIQFGRVLVQFISGNSRRGRRS